MQLVSSKINPLNNNNSHMQAWGCLASLNTSNNLNNSNRDL